MARAWVARPKFGTTWFESGFEGAMMELLAAVGDDRQPENSARGNLAGLVLCFAALRCADTGEAVVPGTVRQLNS